LERERGRLMARAEVEDVTVLEIGREAVLTIQVIP